MNNDENGPKIDTEHEASKAVRKSAEGAQIGERGAPGGWLRNGNPPGDFMSALRCGAQTRRGTACQCPAMANGRCRLHGGLSTGPRTRHGIERIRKANSKHGRYTKTAVES